MLVRCLPPTAFAPLLPLALARIARTPTPLLSTVYRLTARPSSKNCLAAPAQLAAGHRPPSPDVACLAGGALRQLGEALWIDAIVAGGQIGEAAPLANCRCHARQAAPSGGLLEIWA